MKAIGTSHSSLFQVSLTVLRFPLVSDDTSSVLLSWTTESTLVCEESPSATNAATVMRHLHFGALSRMLLIVMIEASGSLVYSHEKEMLFLQEGGR